MKEEKYSNRYNAGSAAKTEEEEVGEK